MPAGGAAGRASAGEEQPLADSVKRGGACLCAHDSSSFPASRPGHPQGYWLAEPTGTAIRGGAHLFSLPHGRRGCLCCAVAVAFGAGSSAFSSEAPLSLPPVTPRNAERLTSL